MVQNSQNAQRLARQLAPYLLDAHTQEFVPSPFYRKIVPSPTESLSYHVTFALLCLGNHDGDVYESVAANVSAFLNACAHASQSVTPGQGHGDNEADLQDAIHTATIAVSLLGFLDAASAQADFWRSGSRLALIQTLQGLLSEKFLVVVETAFSTIRNTQSNDRAAKEWKRYLRHYFELGRPLGAMLLQQRFMTLVAASTSMLVAETSALKQNHVLDLLMSGDGLLRPGTARSGNGDMASVVTYANIVVDQLNYLDASADFIRMGSQAQQNVACAVKAAAIISYLNCSRLNQDAADTETLMAWLEETLGDPDQMGDENLASVVLRSAAIVCKMSPTYGASISRLLPRFIVQGRAPSHVIVTASQCLAYVLRMLSTDAVITTLYALGNVLSPTTEQNGKIDLGIDNSDSPIYGRRQSTGSSISLKITGEEEISTVYANVIDAICGIASSCNDEKISALAQSILLQKYDKISNLVDARVITGAAVLALSGGQLEFRSLLKTYARISHAAVMENQAMILDAVSFPGFRILV